MSNNFLGENRESAQDEHGEEYLERNSGTQVEIMIL